ncbi:MAG TPA: nucleotidyltransferase domain-containing protein [Desulfobacterales bacterium]|nr:nucleotidyltransferase domain-containing protein [Desulfobacterales bacterium]
MAKGPRDPKEIFPAITQELKEIYRENLISIVLYGSAATPAYKPGKSDINLMVVLTEEGIQNLDLAFGFVSRWRKRGVAVPLFLTETYIMTSLDVYPLEYITMQNSYMMVYGPDPLKDLTFDPQWVRLQCEREIKGKLVLLREGFLASQGKRAILKQLASDSIVSFVVIFEGLLFLKGLSPKKDRRNTIKTVCEAYGLDGQLFEKLLDIKEGLSSPGNDELIGLFKSYISQVRFLAQKVDEMII